MSTANIKVTFLCPIEKVWDTVTDLSNYKWRSDIDRIKIIDNSRFIEYSKEGIPTIFKITKKKRYHLWEFKVENENIKGTWKVLSARRENNTGLYGKCDSQEILYETIRWEISSETTTPVFCGSEKRTEMRRGK